MNNAGIGRKIDLFDTTDEQWDRTLEINLKSVFMGMKTAGTYMKEQGSGVIINMASMSGVTGGSQGPDYSASKAGIIALTKFGAKTLGKYGIRVIAWLRDIYKPSSWTPSSPILSLRKSVWLPYQWAGPVQWKRLQMWRHSWPLIWPVMSQVIPY